MFVVGRLCSRNLQDACRLGFSFQSSVSFLALVFLVAQLFVIVRLLWHCQLSLRARVRARVRVLWYAPGWVVFLRIYFLRLSVRLFQFPLCVCLFCLGVSGCKFVFILMQWGSMLPQLLSSQL